MRRFKRMTWSVLMLVLAGCTITATPTVRRQAAVYGEPYVFYQASTPYVYVGGTVYDYNDYYVQYYGPTYVVPAPPRHEGRLLSPPPPVIVGPAPPAQGAHGRGHGHGHD
ncbi:MAG: hypothetical protein JXB32_10720 [Deltaproteobacteria bacterium]|nr:hypothetical protein [Deltaproteobacteria bacterium]